MYGSWAWKLAEPPKVLTIFGEIKRMNLRSESLKQRIEVIMRMFPELHDDEELRFDTLDGETEIKMFLQRCVINVMLYTAEKEATYTTIKKLEERAERWDKRTKFYRALIQDVMQTADLRNISLPEATLNLQTAPSKVVITDETKLPEKAFRIIKSVDKSKLKEMLKDGPVAGAELSNGGQMLVIR